MSVALVTIGVCLAVFTLLLIGLPIYACLGLAGTLGIFLIRGPVGLGQVPALMYGQIDNFVLAAAPLFILMGNVIFHTGIGKDLYEALSRWMNRIPGGLAVATILACAVFGAMCGVSIVGVATIGVMAIPEMLRRGYDRRLAVGPVTAAGALAMLIPPSVLFILYGALANVSVGELFIGGIIPGVVLAAMMSVYVVMTVIRRPGLAPPVGAVAWRERFRPLLRLWPTIIVVFAVLGTIYLGVCTPTESGAIGAAGAFVVALLVYRSVNLATFWRILGDTARTTASVFLIVACALVFGRFLDLVHLPENFARLCAGLQAPPLAVFFLIMLAVFVLGMFIDGASMVIIMTPILLPAVLALGFDPLWFGIMFVLNCEMAVITPPVGLNLYVAKTVAPDIEMEDIIRGTAPFVLVEWAAILLFMFWPALATWLPSLMR